MSFADELRDDSVSSKEGSELDADVYYWCGRLTGAVKTVCRQAALQGKRRIFGYIHLGQREGHEDTEFVQSLPLVRELGMKKGEPGALWDQPEEGTGSSENTGRYETRLYEGYTIPGDVRMIQKIEDSMREELQKLGFTDFRVQKVKLMDIYVIRYRRQSLLSGDLTERFSTRTGPDPVYTLHFSISW